MIDLSKNYKARCYEFLFLLKWTQLCMQQNSVMETWYFNDVASKSAVKQREEC
jgi:hypothetical protein